MTSPDPFTAACPHFRRAAALGNRSLPLISTPDDRRWSGAAKLIMGGLMTLIGLSSVAILLWSI